MKRYRATYNSDEYERVNYDFEAVDANDAARFCAENFDVPMLRIEELGPEGSVK
jgi:hypothetical protein